MDIAYFSLEAGVAYSS